VSDLEGRPAYPGDDEHRPVEGPGWADDGDGDGDGRASDEAAATEPDDDVPPGSVRILASLVDVFVCGLLYLAFELILAAFVQPAADGKYTDEQLRVLQVWTIVFVLVLAVLISFMQSRGRRTLGKRVTGLRLVGPGDAPAAFPRLLVKYAVTFGLFAALGLLGLLIVLICLLSAGLQRERRNVFDQVSGLRPVVVRRSA
jgi:uncharacterized RDD family membrane protein YckC